eukprot:TRINITY_DN10917_c0_g1_i1.p1 TRINITY_DN10917_c0_g1~~TRINITY_DN10917_c0_g1_i1.p1  ORF type:complete len:141 (-),score=11.92 TRINITY_DN10917_c0_g1_i1:221-586(-)
MEEGSQHSAAAIAGYRHSLSQGIWKAFEQNPNTFMLYDLTEKSLDYVFDICSELPDSVCRLLEDEEASTPGGKALIYRLQRNEKLRKYLPPSLRPPEIPPEIPPRPAENQDDDDDLLGLFD